jgi:hypothetical protein
MIHFADFRSLYEWNENQMVHKSPIPQVFTYAGKKAGTRGTQVDGFDIVIKKIENIPCTMRDAKGLGVSITDLLSQLLAITKGNIIPANIPIEAMALEPLPFKTTDEYYYSLYIALPIYGKPIEMPRQTAETKVYLKQIEIQALVDFFIRLLAGLKRTSQTHRDIKPSNIIHGLSSQYRIVDLDQLPIIEAQDSYTRATGMTALYADPRIIKKIATGDEIPMELWAEHDIYCSGMTLLQAAGQYTDEELSYIKNNEKARFDAIAEISKRYSPDVQRVIELFLERQDVDQVCQKLGERYVHLASSEVIIPHHSKNTRLGC